MDEDVGVLEQHVTQHYMYVCVCVCVCVFVCVFIYMCVSWCGGESWVDQRVPRAYIHDVALLL